MRRFRIMEDLEKLKSILSKHPEVLEELKEAFGESPVPGVPNASLPAKEKKEFRTIDRKYPDQPEILGCYVRDTVTFAEGIVTAQSIHITGCNRLSLQVDRRSIGEVLPTYVQVDEPSCEILAHSQLAQSASFETSPNERGGPPEILPDGWR